MREILFRGQNPYTGEWAYGKLTELKERHGHIEPGYYLSNTAGMPFAFHVSGNTLGQYVGLRAADSNRYRTIKGKKEKDLWIFEGDIVRFHNTEGDVFIKQVNWNEELCCVFIGNISYMRLYESGYIQPSKVILEIIGNLWDTPELLGKTL
jgi:hypothetical protein